MGLGGGRSAWDSTHGGSNAVQLASLQFDAIIQCMQFHCDPMQSIVLQCNAPNIHAEDVAQHI